VFLLLPIGSGYFEPNLYLHKYPSNLVPVILTAYTDYEDGTDGVFQNMAHKIQTPANRPKERIQHSERDGSLESGNVCSY